MTEFKKVSIPDDALPLARITGQLSTQQQMICHRTGLCILLKNYGTITNKKGSV